MASPETEYPSVQAALQALRSRPDVVFSTKNGWTQADDNATNTTWSFAPSTYRAYPALVKRQVIQEGGQIMVRVSAQCEGSRSACDDLRHWLSTHFDPPN